MTYVNDSFRTLLCCAAGLLLIAGCTSGSDKSEDQRKKTNVSVVETMQSAETPSTGRQRLNVVSPIRRDWQRPFPAVSNMESDNTATSSTGDSLETSAGTTASVKTPVPSPTPPPAPQLFGIVPSEVELDSGVFLTVTGQNLTSCTFVLKGTEESVRVEPQLSWTSHTVELPSNILAEDGYDVIAVSPTGQESVLSKALKVVPRQNQ